MNDSIFGKTMENVKKHNNQSTEKLFDVRTKLSYNKRFPR